MASSTVPHSSTSIQDEDERPWACNYPNCTKAYRRKSNLNQHKLRHIDPDSLEYERRIKRCTYVYEDGKACKYTTFQKASIEIHNFVHTGERPYACRSDQCVQTFQNPSSRIKHEKDHGIMPAEYRTRAKFAQKMASANEAKGGSNRFTPYSIPSESVASSSSVPSSSLGSGYGYPQSSLAPTPTYSDTSGPFYDNTISPAAEIYSNMTIPPFRNTMSHFPLAPSGNFINDQEQFQQRDSPFQPGCNTFPTSLLDHNGHAPFYAPLPSYQVSQPSIAQSSSWSSASIPLAQPYPQLDTSYGNSFFANSGPSASVHSYSNELYSNNLVVPSIPSGGDNSGSVTVGVHLSEEELAALDMYYSPFPPSQAPFPPSYTHNYEWF